MKWRIDELKRISTSSFSDDYRYEVLETRWFVKKEEAYKFYHDNKDKKPLSYPYPVSEVKV
jgi:hypothetical protein